jgi:hypothetical protein
MNNLPLHWVVVCENESDATIVTTLADRYAEEPENGLPEWVRDNLDAYRAWEGDEPGRRCLLWKKIKERADKLHLSVHGYGNRRLGLENAEIRKAFTLVTRAGRERPSGILLARDTDADAGRREGYRRAVAVYAEATTGDVDRVRLCLALAHPEIEAWLLAGFEPKTDSGRAALAEERQTLGFDPCDNAADLNPKRTFTPEGREVKKSTKRILDKLLSADGASKESTFRNAPLSMLRARGGATGLADFFDALSAEYLDTLRSAGA